MIDNINIDASVIDAIVKYLGTSGLILILIGILIYILLPGITKYYLMKNEQKYRFRFQLKIARLNSLNHHKKNIIIQKNTTQNIKESTTMNTKTKYFKNQPDKDIIFNKKTAKIIISILIVFILILLVMKFSNKHDSK